MFQLLNLPDAVLLRAFPSHLPESRVLFFACTAESLSIATTMNSLLQMTVSVLPTQGNGAA
jgi:hypothetical protein